MPHGLENERPNQEPLPPVGERAWRELPDEAATATLAREVAATLQGGEVLLLEGEMGAGKTHFVRGVVEALEHPDPREVASPTFALLHRYEGGRLPVDHLDLHRLEGGAALGEQGLLDPWTDPISVVLVEWAERLGAAERGAAAWRLVFEHLPQGEGRRVAIECLGPLPGTSAQKA